MEQEGNRHLTFIQGQGAEAASFPRRENGGSPHGCFLTWAVVRDRLPKSTLYFLKRPSAVTVLLSEFRNDYKGSSKRRYCTPKRGTRLSRIGRGNESE